MEPWCKGYSEQVSPWADILNYNVIVTLIKLCVLFITSNTKFKEKCLGVFNSERYYLVFFLINNCIYI